MAKIELHKVIYHQNLNLINFRVHTFYLQQKKIEIIFLCFTTYTFKGNKSTKPVCTLLVPQITITHIILHFSLKILLLEKQVQL